MMRDEHRACSVVVAVVAFLSIVIAPLIVNFLFAHEAPCDLMRARFSAGDLLGYLGSALVGVGSIVLAAFAFLQTGRINKVEQEMKARQDRFERQNMKRPYFIVDSVLIDAVPIEADGKGVFKCDEVSDNATLSVRLKNIGNGPACQFRMREELGFGTPSAMQEHRYCVPEGAYFTFATSIKELTKSETSVARLKYENIIGCSFSQRIDFRIKALAIYAKEREEIEDGYFVDIIIGQSLQILVSSLTMQSTEKSE